MPKWSISVECLAPSPYIIINYQGKKPFEVYKRVKDLLREVVQISSAWYFENEFRWDITSDPRSFHIRVGGRSKYDAHTYVWYEITLRGSQPSDINKPGNLTIKIFSQLVTEYNLNTPFRRSTLYKLFLRIYNFLFYWRQRRKYVELCVRDTKRLEEAFRDLLKEISK